MKRKWYRSNGTKAAWIIVEIIVITLAMLSGFFLLALRQQGILLFDKESNNYLKSESFAYDIFEIGYELLSNIEKTRTLDEASEDAVVSLDAYVKDHEISFGDSGTLRYRLEDLEKWSDQMDGDYFSGGGQVIVCRSTDDQYDYYYLDDFRKLVKSGDLKIIIDHNSYGGITEDDILSSLEIAGRGSYNGDYNTAYDGTYNINYITDGEGKMLYDSVWNYGLGSIGEKYAPIGAENLLEVVNGNSEWNGRLSEIYDALADIMETLADYRSAKSALEQYEEGNTNLTYLYVDKENRSVYTNKSEYGVFSGYEKSVLKMTGGEDPFILVQPKLKDCDTNLNMGSDLQRWSHIIGGHSRSEDYVYAVSVDKDLPMEDSLYYAKEAYEKYVPYMVPAAAVCLGSLIIFVIGLVWLTAAAGRRPEDEELYLCSFDKWFTEIGAGAVIGIWGIGAVFSLQFLEYLTVERLQFRIVAAFLAVITAAMCLIGYLSLVRRIKGGILWKNSLLRWLLGRAGRVWRRVRDFVGIYGLNTGGKVKNTLILSGFMILQVWLILNIWSSDVFLLILFILDLSAIVYCMWKNDGRDRILKGLRNISEGDLQYKISLDRLKGDQREIAERINSIGQGLDSAVENSLKNERMKTELITNVSHDIKTPLTSIINYVDLLKRENFTDPRICSYLDILEQKAQRLKALTEDVVEASKAATGNINLEMTELNFTEMVQQAAGEFQEKFRERDLTMVVLLDEKPMTIRADGRRLWRVLENLFNNVVKYAMEGTRVYVELKTSGIQAVFSMKNISAQSLNISADELTERFIRGDVSRNTEGSGLGLSIAKSLTELQGGDFQLYLDGDLFKVILTFPMK